MPQTKKKENKTGMMVPADRIFHILISFLVQEAAIPMHGRNKLPNRLPPQMNAPLEASDKMSLY
jgi:hypothetical protein